MIFRPGTELVYSSLGWVDHGSIWIYDCISKKASTVELSDAEYLTIHDSGGEFLLIAHHWSDRTRFKLSVHRRDRRLAEVARSEIISGQIAFDGDISAWKSVPREFVSFLDIGGQSDYLLLIVRPESKTVDLHRLDWFDDSYDKGYQGVTGVVAVPDSHLVIISVQRDSSPVLFDTRTDMPVKKLRLAGRHGNPTLRFGNGNRFLWADDYDTLLKLDAADFRVVSSRLIQEPDGSMSQFMGAYWLLDSENECVVARPFSGDVVAVSTDDLRTLRSCKLSGQPVEAVALNEGQVVARDWQSGILLTGTFDRKRRFFFFA